VANATTVESLLEELKAQRESAEARAAEDAERIRGLEQQVSLLIDELRHMRRARFGRSSERLEPGQLSMYDDALEPASASEPVRIPAHDRRTKKPGHGRPAFPDHLPREVVELDVPEDGRICADCGEEMRAIGVDCSEVARFVPAKLVVTRYERKKYACRAGHGVVTADKPPGVVDRGKYDASVYAHIATAKYSDHLPLHRQEGIWKRYGLKLAKQTMWDLLVRLDELVAQPILAQMRQELRSEPVLHADETPITLRPEQGKGTKQGWIWLWRSLSRPGPPKAMVEFLESRGRDGPLAFLRGVSPVLIIDGY
jgi:transposase